MSIIALQSLSQKFGLNLWIVKSWFLQGAFFDLKSGTKFFEENIEIIKATPFVKWVGGKRQLISQLEKLFPKEFNNYFEPFVGGGAVFFNLQKEKSFLSDINEELINTYKVIKENPKKLIKFLETCEYSAYFYEDIRSWDRQEDWQKNYSEIERAGRFIYLNRTCFNGLYRVNSKGQFNVPMGAYKNPDFVQKENIINTSKLLNKTKAEIKLHSFDKVLENANSGDFIYFDPPYDTLSETANFTSYNENGFGREMQKKLAEVFRKLDEKGCKVMLSNHNTPFIREIYDGFRFEIVKARRNVNSKASGRGEVEEIVVMNY
ncbi:MAG: DNA adenine methylase [Candidatus Gracilibacteria bacterium]|nr:DNA adenine methylase [Candidatus Gracilibacteria bacterium]